MSLLVLATAFLTLHSPARAAVQVSVDAKPGEVLTGERAFRVTANSDTVISKVEFYVGNDLRESEDATPYVFHFDTVAEADGTYHLKFKAYTVENQTGEKEIDVKVNNGLDKGADFHVKMGEDLLSDSKWDEARDQGRIALKIDAKSNPARIVLARAYLGKGVYDQAQRYAEDAVAQDGEDTKALSILSSVDAQRAFNTIAKEGSDRAEVLGNIKDAFKGAVDNRRKALDLTVDKMPAPTDATAITYADAAMAAERYSLAVQTLDSAWQKDQKNLAIGDRLAYAYLRTDRTTQALQTLMEIKKQVPLDAYGNALVAVALAQQNNDVASDEAMRDAILADPDNLGVRTAQAFIALKRNKTSVLAKLSSDLGREQGQRADVNYFLMALANRQQNFGAARRYFERAVLAEPADPDLYIEQGNYSIGLTLAGKLEDKDKQAQYESAKVMYQTALAARPEASDALSGLAIVALLQKNPKDALAFANAAVRATPNSAGAHYTLAAASQAAGLIAPAQRENLLAGKLDKSNLEGREIPGAIAAWRYLNTGGRQVVIAAPK